jgi:SAM-dependent methyltransferase
MFLSTFILMKDNFSSASDLYAKFRPSYPPELYNYLRDNLPTCENAWDCGTGNGQVAAELAKFFKTVCASDISEQQIEQAVKLPNISYSVQPAEKTNFPDRFFDLIVVAQAIHWFDFGAFYKEVHRVAKPGALLVVIGYGNLGVNPAIDEVIEELYQDITGPYWDPERRYIDENYSTIPFTGDELACPSFTNSYDWTPEHLLGYLGTWSGVKHYIKATGKNPLEMLGEKFKKAWGLDSTRKVRFPLLLRVAKL